MEGMRISTPDPTFKSWSVYNKTHRYLVVLKNGFEYKHYNVIDDIVVVDASKKG